MDDKWLLLIGGALVLGLLLLKRRGNNTAIIAPRSYVLRPRRQQPANYVNEETLDITWNEDGLPTKVVIHRKAQMS